MKTILTYNSDRNCFIDTSSDKTTIPTSNDIIYLPDAFSIETIKNIECFAVSCDAECSVINNYSWPLIFIPSMTMGMLNWANELSSSVVINNSLTTEYCFCWSINKKSLDRYLVIKLIEWFGLDSYKYTWSGIGRDADCSQLIQEFNNLSVPWLTANFQSTMLAPINLPDNFIFVDDITTGEKIDNNVGLQAGRLLSQWSFVQEPMASNSAVYLLTESFSNFEKNYTFTEKTGWALMSKNFPIWAGNYGQAEQAKRMGIDIFADVINHDYQWHETIIERCYHAIADNLKILTNLEAAQFLRKKHHERLTANQHWYLNGGLKNYVDLQMKVLGDI